MGCDIHITAERKTANGYEAVTDVTFASGLAPFDWRSYGMYAFLAGVRNYSDIRPLASARGLPSDMSTDAKEDYDAWSMDAHSCSWISVEELSSFDYDQSVEDRRVTRQVAANAWDGGCTAEPGGGRMTTYREFLGDGFFEDLAKLKECCAHRIVFWFDC